MGVSPAFIFLKVVIRDIARGDAGEQHIAFVRTTHEIDHKINWTNQWMEIFSKQIYIAKKFVYKINAKNKFPNHNKASLVIRNCSFPLTMPIDVI